jgi:hypothetical protein
MIGNFLRGLVLNPYVEGAIIATVLIGFGPNVWTFVKRLRRDEIGKYLPAVIMLAGALAVLLVIYQAIYSELVEVPRSYLSPPSALRNADGSKRIFSSQTLGALAAPFRDSTNLRARELLSREIGKWKPVTGIVWDISVASADRALLVTLKGKNTDAAYLNFASRWTGTLDKLSIGDRIYAVCKIHDATAISVTLDNCELAPP